VAKCRGSKEDGTACRQSTMYKSDFCKKHRSQDPSFTTCMGKQASGKPCIREALVGELFCRGHLTQKGNLEKLHCPRGCGLLTYRMGLNNAWFYHCGVCKGAMLDAKLLETKLAEDLALKFNNLLDASTKVGKLNCPSCEGLMFGFKIVYVMPEGGRGVGGLHFGGDLNMGGAGLIGLLFVGAVIVAASSAGKDEVDYDEEEFGGSVMVIDGCKDCGNFWFDRKELKTVTVAEKIRAAKEWEEEATRPMLRPAWSPAQASGRASNTNCLHIDEKNGKNCRRVTFRSTEYCYMHQQD